MKLFLAILGVALLASCALRPLKPGYGWIMKPDGSVIGIQQSENPKSDSIIKSGETELRIGASQKDVARETAAKLASLRPVVFLGVAVFLFGIASAVWAPLKVIVGSITTSAVIAVSGLALIILPTIIVGHEALIMVLSLGAALAWFFAHRHGKARGELESLKK